MSGVSMFVMITSMIILWGGLAASIIHAVKKSKTSTKNEF